MSELDIEAAMRLLAGTWSRRTEAERDALAGQAADELPETTAALDLVRSRAALSGAVAPRDLVGGLAAEDADRVLDVLAADFDRTVLDGEWTWTLRSGPRAETLAGLLASARVHPALDDVVGIPTDEAGEILRALAGARPRGLRPLFRRFTRPKDDDGAVLQALTWAAPLGGKQHRLAEARRRAGLTAVRDSYANLLELGVHGRERELRLLREFAAADVDEAEPVPLLAVTGLGGTGKSTLLAELAVPYLDRRLAAAEDDPDDPIVVVIDFDRVVFRANAEPELSFEVTRQLGWACPTASADFSVLRHQVREERRQTGTDQVADAAEALIRTASGFELDAKILVGLHGLGHRKVVLVLDTFEEWQHDRPVEGRPRVGWNDPERRIQEWISRLRTEMGLAGLRVIASGRAPVSAMDGVRAVEPIGLGDLDAAAAVRVIAAFDVGRSAAAVLAEAVGGNPLALRVAARFYRNLPRAERRQFVATAHEDHPGLDDELRSAVLYDRFLNHIHDQRVRRLAHPGLVLRRVTPALVQHVLAPHCALGEVGERTARELTERLADEVWLVRTTPDGLRHHPDVRRAMLRMMTGDPARAEGIRAIHRAAADWYRSGRDPGLRADAAGAEALYHLLMLEDGERPITAVLGDDPTGLPRLTATSADFRPKVAAQVRALRGDGLTDREAVELPAEVWHRWIASHGTQLLSEGLAERALHLFEDRLRQRADVSEPEWLARAYCDTARWRQYWPTLRRVEQQAVPPREPAFHAGRYALINALVSQEPQDVAHYDRDLAARLLRRSHADIERFQEIGGDYLALLRTRGMDPPPGRPVVAVLRDSRSEGTRDSRDRYPVDELRRALVWLDAPASRGFRLRGLPGIFRPDPAWVRDWVHLFGAADTDFATQLARLAKRPAARSDELLGEWSARFARSWADGARLRVDRLAEAPELVRVLRGDNPELRPAVRLAVAAVADRYGVRAVAEPAAGLLPIPVRDLRPDALPKRVTAERTPLVQLVEYVDRSGVLHPFLSALHARYPQFGIVRDVTDACRAWDDAQGRLLTSIAERLRER
jgi:hypothetical protein